MNRMLRMIFGSALYWIIEILYKGHSHWSMALVGGISFIVGGEIDEHTPKRPIWQQCVIITFVITALEYATGLLLNRKYKIWDYRKEKWNLDGQVCVKFTLIWLVIISPLIIIVDNYLRSKVRNV